MSRFNQFFSLASTSKDDNSDGYPDNQEVEFRPMIKNVEIILTQNHSKDTGGVFQKTRIVPIAKARGIFIKYREQFRNCGNYYTYKHMA